MNQRASETEPQSVTPRSDWIGCACIVAGSGPSLSEAPIDYIKRKSVKIIAVNDSYQLLPFADVLYACDAKWWDVHNGVPEFSGEKWSTHDEGSNKKITTAEKYGLNLVKGESGKGFSVDTSVIHYGDNSGFQAINLAVLLGAKTIFLIGFDMHSKNGRHFFGNHPEPLTNNVVYERFIKNFDLAAQCLPEGLKIINCTPDSAIKCFPFGNLMDLI